MAENTYVAVKLADSDGVVKLHIASVVTSFPTSADLPAGASGEMTATVAALEDMLGSDSAALIPPGTIGLQAQLISGN